MTETKKRTKREAREAKERAVIAFEEMRKLAAGNTHDIYKPVIAKLREDFYKEMGLKMPEEK